MSTVKHVRCDMTQLLQAHAPEPLNLAYLLDTAKQAAESEVSVSGHNLRLMVGLDASAPAATLEPEETGRPEETPRSSLAARMVEINAASGEEVFPRSEILATLEWEHSP